MSRPTTGSPTDASQEKCSCGRSGRWRRYRVVALPTLLLKSEDRNRMHIQDVTLLLKSEDTNKMHIQDVTLLLKREDTNKMHIQDATLTFFSQFPTRTQMLIGFPPVLIIFCTTRAADALRRNYRQSIIWPNFNGIPVLNATWQEAVETFLMTSTQKNMAR